MNLFPNLEYLAFNCLKNLQNSYVNRLASTHVTNPDGSGKAPSFQFPRLKLLDVPISRYEE